MNEEEPTREAPSVRIEPQKPNTSQKRNRRGMIDKQLELVRHWVPKTQFKPTLFVDEDNDLVEADVVRGRTLTSYPTSQTDIRNAGGERMDEEMATDQGLVTSRRPDVAFCAKIVEEFAKGKHADSVETGRLSSWNLPNRSRR